MKHVYRHLTINILIAAGVFYLSLLMHAGRLPVEVTLFGIPGATYYSIHFLLSLLRKKYHYDGFRSFKKIFPNYFTTWLISSGTGLLILVLFDIDYLSREWILVNLFGLLTGEAILVILISFFRESAHVREQREIAENGRLDVTTLYPPPPPGTVLKEENPEFREQLQAIPELSDFISKYFDLTGNNCRVMNSGSSIEFLLLPTGRYEQIINTFRLDFTYGINTLLRTANSRLPDRGLLLVCSETINLRKKRLMRTTPVPLKRLICFLDALVMQFFPSMPGGRKLNRMITGGKRRAISRPEILGRLSACGFEIVEEKKIRGLLYVVAGKVNLPVSHVASSYGWVIHLNRIGTGGKTFRFYKLRTMFPFSEYIQEYIYKNSNLSDNGKFRDDFRITPFGKFLRKFWIDELPGLWNWIRGDMKLVGVRPLSKHFFSLYTQELQQKRIRFKPGLIPPFYADLPKNLDEIMASENRYLDEYEKSPFSTDLRYFFKALYNILIKGAKSR